jgi:hypothetical protein
MLRCQIIVVETGLVHRSISPLLVAKILPAWLPRLARVTLIVVTSTPAARRAPTATGAPATAARTTATAARPSATETSTALGLGTRLIDIQCTTAKFFSVQCRNRLLGFGSVGHFDESKSARPPGIPVSDDTYLIDFSVGLKQRAQLGFGCAVGDVANEKLLHGVSFSSS